MRVNIDFYYDKEEDGIECSSSASRSGVLDLSTMSQFLADAMRGAGYSYVTDVGFAQDDGTVTFGEM